MDNVIVEIKKLWKLLKIDSASPSFREKAGLPIINFSGWFKSLRVLIVDTLLDSTISDSVNNNKITLK